MGCCTKTLKHLNDLFFYGFMAIQIEIVHGTSIFVSPLFGAVLCPYCHNTYTAIMPTLSLLFIYFLCWPFVELLWYYFFQCTAIRIIHFDFLYSLSCNSNFHGNAQFLMKCWCCSSYGLFSSDFHSVRFVFAQILLSICVNVLTSKLEDIHTAIESELGDG